jgi:hypothetical protein
MNSREFVQNTITFRNFDRLPYDLPEKYGTDFSFAQMTPSPDDRPKGKGTSVDEWGAIWENLGICSFGEVKDFPLKEWDDFSKLNIPDIKEPRRWKDLDAIRNNAAGKFLLGSGISIYERVHFIRGLENTWTDIYLEPEKLCRLIDLLVEMNLYAIQKFAEAGFDGLIFCDDWGLQDRLMIPPDSWRKIWKPRYRKIYETAHAHGLFTFLHSCGYIVDILDDLIEVGLDVIHMDQQENMGLELLGNRFGGRITFFSPVDIQTKMVNGSPKEIRQYCREMVNHLSRPGGGFIPRWYTDPTGAGHSQQALDIMCDEFLKLSRNHPMSSRTS